MQILPGVMSRCYARRHPRRSALLQWRIKDMKRVLAAMLLCLLPLTAWCAANASADDTYDQDTVIKEAEGFFGKGAKGIAQVIAKVFKEKGRPNGFIKGEEAGGALVVGVRYGDGTLQMKDGERRKVHWQGPSVGFDAGANVSKVFVLVYHLPNANAIFRRYPGVDGSLYFVAGVGVNYVEADNIVLAPIRLGVGWRQGVNAGYMHVTRTKSWNPF
jgi:hypothetical protein